MATKKLIDLDLLTTYDTKIKEYIDNHSSTGSGIEVYDNYSLLPTTDVKDKTIAYCEEDYTDETSTNTYNKGFYEYKITYGWIIISSSVDDNYLTKQEYASEVNEGSVKLADKAKALEGTELAKPYQFWGVDANGNAKYLYLPFKNDTGTGAGGIEQRVLLNVVANEILEIESINKLDECKLFVQAFKFKKGEENVVSTVKEFNNSHKDSFYYNTQNVHFTNNGCSILTKRILTPTLSENIYRVSIDKMLYGRIENITLSN